jgi:hypothetical protein
MYRIGGEISALIMWKVMTSPILYGCETWFLVPIEKEN